MAALPGGRPSITELVAAVAACGQLGDGDAAGRLWPLLDPWAGHHLTAGHTYLGAADHHLGILAATAGRWREGQRHFQAALAAHERLGARPWQALTAQASRACSAAGTPAATRPGRTASTPPRRPPPAASAWTCQDGAARSSAPPARLRSPMLLAGERRLIADFGRRMTADRLVVGTSGNLSIRSGDLLAVTPVRARLRHAHPRAGRGPPPRRQAVSAALAPTSELAIHQLIYAHTDALAVVHTHSTAATVVSTLVEELPAIHYILAVLGGPVRVAPYATFGTPELAANVLAALDGRSGVLLANHGAVTYGPSIEVAYDRALYLEWVAEVWLRANALSPAFTPRILGEPEMAEVDARLGGAYPTTGRSRDTASDGAAGGG